MAFQLKTILYIHFSFWAYLHIHNSSKELTKMNNTPNQHLKRSLHNQCITMNPQKMIASVYGIPNKTSLPTIYMNAPVNCPVKKPEVSASKRFISNYLPFLAGLTTFAVVLCLLTFFMDESRRLNFICTYEIRGG